MGLGMLGNALVGFAGGVGEAAENITNKYIDRETEQLKQDRLNEWETRKMALEDQYAARKEQRGLIKSLAEKQAEINMNTDPQNVKAAIAAEQMKRRAELDFNTDPATIKRKTDAELQGQKAKDEYSDSRTDKEVAKKKAEYDATHPYEAKEMQAKINNYNSEIERRKAMTKDEGERRALEEKKTSLENLRHQHEAAGKRLEQIDERLATGADDEATKVGLGEERKALVESYKALDGQISALVGGDSQGGSGGDTGTDFWVDPGSNPVIGAAQSMFMGEKPKPGGAEGSRGGTHPLGDASQFPGMMVPVADANAGGARSNEKAKPEHFTNPSGILKEDVAKAFGGLDDEHKKFLYDNKDLLTMLKAKEIARFASIPMDSLKNMSKEVLIHLLVTGNVPRFTNRV